MLQESLEPLTDKRVAEKAKSAVSPENMPKHTKTYTYEEVFTQAVKYFKGDELAANVWINKYALKDSYGKIYENSPDQMHRRIATEIARIENKYPNPYTVEEIYNVLSEFKYIVPQGGPMTGIGNEYQVASLSNCFVIGNGSNADSYGAIMKTDEEQVQLMKRRGGVGHDLSHIRPYGTPVMNSALTSTGIVPFMERYSNSTREVAQDGRRGALMLTMSIKHPDAEKFIDAKLDGTKVTGANVSVKITDDFMKAVVNDTEFMQQFPVDSAHPKVTKLVSAKQLWDKIVHNAWKAAEPGVLFWDTVIKESLPDCYADLGFTTVSTNPCGEIPLCPYDSCRLLAINLFSYVDHPFTPEASFDFDLFKKHVKMAQRIMDDIVDLEMEKIDQIIGKIETDPEPVNLKRVELNLWKEIKIKCEQGRRTGVGITGEGDMLAALDLRYGTEPALDFAVEVQRTLAVEAYRTSVEMARDRGAFPIYDTNREKNNPFIARLKEVNGELYEMMAKYGRRNIALLTIAPTGTTSIMTQTTSGVEPVFMASYKRRRKVNPHDLNARVDFVDEIGDSWEEYHVFHHQFVKWLQVKGYDVEVVGKMPDAELQEVIAQSPYYKATANDVDWVVKVKMQGAIQKWVDHSISVTVNVPNDATEDLIAQIYKTGWETGCKGMTVYRDGSRSGVLVSDDKNKKKDKETIVEEFRETHAPTRPKVLDAEFLRFSNDSEKWIAVVGLFNGRPYEIFTGRAEDSFIIPQYVTKGWVIRNINGGGKSRYDFQYMDRDGYNVTIEGLSRSFDKQYWNYAKLISGILRHGMPIAAAVDMVSNLQLDSDSLNSWKNGVARALKKYIKDGVVPADNICENCGEASLVYEEGCLNCKSCGDSKCS